MRVVCVALLLASSCTRDEKRRTPERLAADYASAPKDHYEDLTAASQRWLPQEMIFEGEPLPEAPGATCRAVESRPDRLRFDCSNANGQSRTVLLLRENGSWRVAETSRAYRLLRKARLDIDAYAAALHGAEIDPEEGLFDAPVARQLYMPVVTARLAGERLARAKPFAERILARNNLRPGQRAALLMGRARLEFSAPRALSEEESRQMLDRSMADAAEAAQLDPTFAEEQSQMERRRALFRRESDLMWLASTLRRQREKHAAAAGEEKKQRQIYRWSREIASHLVHENCRAEDWQAEFESAQGDAIRLRVPAGEDFAVSLVGEGSPPEVLEAARSLQPGECVIFSGSVNTEKQSEAETMRAPKLLVNFEQLDPCPERRK